MIQKLKNQNKTRAGLVNPERSGEKASPLIHLSRPRHMRLVKMVVE